MAPAAPLDRGAQRRCGRDRRRLHRNVGGLADQGAGARGARGPARGRGAGAGRVDETAALPTRCGSRWRACASAGAIERRWRSPAPPRPRLPRLGASVSAGRRGLVQARWLPAGLHRPRPRSRPGSRASGPSRAWRSRRGADALPGRGGRPLRLTGLPGGVFYPARRPCSPLASLRPARAAGRRGVEVCESSPVRSLRGGPGGVGPRPRSASFAPARPCLRSGRRRRRPPGRFASAHGRLLPHRPHRASSGSCWRKWLDRGECITDSRALINYFRTTPEGGSSLAGGAVGSRWGHVWVVAASSTRRWFPARRSPPAALLPGLRRPPHDPRLGRADRRLTHPPAAGGAAARRATFVAAGYTGNGVGPSHMVQDAGLAGSGPPRQHSRLAFVDPSPARVPRSPCSGSVGKRSGWRSCAPRRPSSPVASPTRSAPPSPASRS